MNLELSDKERLLMAGQQCSFTAKVNSIQAIDGFLLIDLEDVKTADGRLIFDHRRFAVRDNSVKIPKGKVVKFDALFCISNNTENGNSRLRFDITHLSNWSIATTEDDK